VRLLLWDIDGTLVNTAGHGRRAFMQAFETVLGRAPAVDDVPMAGRTDHAICLDLLDANGVEDPEAHVPRMFEELHLALVERRGLMAEQGGAQPGVRDALTRLGLREDVLQSLLTGNIEPNAAVKLAAFGLESLVDLEIGGYGSDHVTRSELVGVARRKALELRGVDVAPPATVIVGDTPLDIDAAHAAGARAVAVATGPYSLEELSQAGPDAALEDVTDVAALVAALGLPA
jgi:phosphoglycolate phosphatase